MQATARPIRLLRQRVRAVTEALPAAAAGEVRGVHRARVATRRLRAWLPALGGLADAGPLRRLRRAVRRLTRALGPVRELDVALGHLDSIGRDAGVPDRVLARVRGQLRTQRLAARRDLLQALERHPADRLTALAETIGIEPADAEPLMAAAVREARARAAQRALALSAAIGAAGPLYAAEPLHEVRIAAKQLRYALEVDLALSGSRAERQVRQLKGLQDILGLVHDYEVLAAHVRAVQSDSAVGQPAVARHLDTLLLALERACRAGHARFLRARPLFIDLCRAVAAAGRAGRPTFQP
jgi:CHAD domain-containing protein